MSTTQTAPLKPGIDLDQLCINTIRTLSIDAVQQANPGIPVRRWGSPLWCTPSGTASLRFDPQDPIWPNRDRFRAFRMVMPPCCSGPCCT